MALIRSLSRGLADLLDIATLMLLGILALPCNVVVGWLRAFGEGGKRKGAVA